MALVRFPIDCIYIFTCTPSTSDQVVFENGALSTSHFAPGAGMVRLFQYAETTSLTHFDGN